MSRRQVVKAAAGTVLGFSLADPLAAIAKPVKCKHGHRRCGPHDCCPPGTVCHATKVGKKHHYVCKPVETNPKTPAPTCSDGVKNGTETDVDCGGGACPACANGKNCRVGTDCLSGHCDGGVCAQCGAATDCPAAAAGSCQQAACMGGVCGFTANATNAPASSACTTVTCVNGAPSSTFVAADTSCGTGATTVCDGAGNCVGCVSTKDCPAAAAGSCQQATCTSGTCGFAADDANAPASTVCAAATCVAGVPTRTFAAAHTSCGTGKVCDGAGNCVGCATAADCPAASAGSCQQATCTSGTCGFAADDANVAPSTACTTHTCTSGTPSTMFVAAETPCGSGPSMVCDGAGNCVGCDRDADCPAAAVGSCQTAVCNSGTCGTATKTSGSTCSDGGVVCDGNGNCVGCLDDNNCSGKTPACNTTTNTCVNCTATNTSFCTGTTLICDTATNTCVQCTNDTQCSMMEVCDTTNNTCVECVTATQCPVNGTGCQAPTCDNNICGVMPVSSGVVCNTGGGAVCDGNGNCVACVADAQCFGSTPACDTSTNTCVTCTATNTSQCTGSTRVCDTSTNTCVVCAGDADCGSPNLMCQSNACVCKPQSCVSLGYVCGLIGDGCGGGPFSCGNCASGHCGGAGLGHCGTGTCNPQTCEQQGFNCGAASDTCGNSIECGSCSLPGQTCGGGGMYNVCGQYT